MIDKTAQQKFQDHPPASGNLAPAGGMARSLVLKTLSRIASGELDIVEGTSRQRLGKNSEDGLQAEIIVEDARFYRTTLVRGSVGAAEAYIAGWWKTPDLTAVIRILARNLDALDSIDSGWQWLSKPLLWAYHLLNWNSFSGSQKNISAHYDLSNQFFQLMLDPTMCYSCGIFKTPDSSLEEASIEKMDRLCRKLYLQPEDHLLEIGTGWGALAIHAAKEYGCRVTTTTISREQHDLARTRIDESGLQGQIDLRFEDYRKLTGTYDKIISVEMIEAIGRRQFGTFWKKCGALLAPGGRLALQSITIQDHRFETASREVDFIKRHIFPGSCIPGVSALLAAAASNSDLRLVHMEEIGSHYPKTLATWRDNVFSQLDTIKTLGMDQRFIRLWEFYLCYCEGGFIERTIGDAQMILERPGAKTAPILGNLA
ncbi:MAG: cyclopropane-fatty-acyl-phospholipid synthase family protein [Planctomycetota bacterium]